MNRAAAPACIVPDCPYGALTRGWCSRHYYRWRKHGSPTAGGPIKRGSPPGPRPPNGICLAPDCEDPYAAKGYCGRHYAEVIVRGREPGPRQKRSPLERDDVGRKRCSVCKDWLPESSFHQFKHSRDGLERACKACKSARNALYRHKVTPIRYAEALARQGGCCPCGEVASLVVDHDHSCCPGEYGCANCFRGLLCSGCNKAAGFCRDDPEKLLNLASYLEDWEARICA